MNYLQRNRPLQKKWISKPVVAIPAILVGTLLLYLIAWNFLNPVIFAIGRPIWSAKNYISDQVVKVWSSFKNTEELATENAKLQQELIEAKISLESLDAYKKENEILKSGFGQTNSEKRIVVAIMAKPNLSPYDTLILDAGTSQGISVGNKVMSGDFIIGTISETHSNYSKATVLSEPGELLNATIGNKNIQIEATGRGGGNFTAKLPKEIDVKVGDLVKMPGLNPKFFGIVGSVEQTQTGSFQTILFSLPVNINELSWVEVINNKENAPTNNF